MAKNHSQIEFMETTLFPLSVYMQPFMFDGRTLDFETTLDIKLILSSSFYLRNCSGKTEKQKYILLKDYYMTKFGIMVKGNAELYSENKLVGVKNIKLLQPYFHKYEIRITRKRQLYGQ